MRADARARGRLGGVEVRDEPEPRRVLGPGARGDVGGHVGVVAHGDVPGAELAQLVGEEVGEVELAGGGGDPVGVLVARLGVHLHVAEEPLEDIGSGVRLHR